MAKISQKDLVKNHLLNHGSITSWEAIQKYGITRISAVIFKLREEGLKIESVPMKNENRYGEITHFVKYTMEGQENVMENYKLEKLKEYLNESDNIVFLGGTVR